MFSTAAAPVYIPTNSAERFLFLHTLSSICYLYYQSSLSHVCVCVCVCIICIWQQPWCLEYLKALQLWTVIFTINFQISCLGSPYPILWEMSILKVSPRSCNISSYNLPLSLPSLMDSQSSLWLSLFRFLCCFIRRWPSYCIPSNATNTTLLYGVDFYWSLESQWGWIYNTAEDGKYLTLGTEYPVLGSLSSITSYGVFSLGFRRPAKL